ncbi:MAG: hypothetical protein JSR29_21255 [Nitrospira sp.]|nr:hypothetical protein [Nitrospira sp.]
MIMVANLNLKAGERVRVRSKQEILATLDEQGTVDKLPFMPEMLQYCGREFTVYKRAEKTCDTIEKTGARRVMSAVHLEDVRCDGSAHGGCGARCLMYWKEAWLERPNTGVASSALDISEVSHQARSSVPLSETQLLAMTTRSSEESLKGGEVYRCQITDLLKFSTPLSSLDICQYMRDLQCGNVGLGSLLSALIFRSYQRLMKLPGLRVWYWIYDTFQKLRGGVPFPYRTGRLEGKTPSDKLDLQPGELVRIKSHEEIFYTLDKNNRNRGLLFDAEQVPYCGKTAKVLCRVEKIINERTGKMMKLPNDCLILEGVYCRAHYSSDRLFCPRSIYSYWREIWLKRVTP